MFYFFDSLFILEALMLIKIIFWKIFNIINDEWSLLNFLLIFLMTLDFLYIILKFQIFIIFLMYLFIILI